MLRQVFIVKDDQIVFKRDFGKALDDDGYTQAYKQVSKEAFKITTETLQSSDFFKYRLNYLALPKHKLIFLFVTDLSDLFKTVSKELQKCKKEFMNLFEPLLDDELDEDTLEIFDPTIELIHKNLRPKISLVGFSGVGKTTITRLITAQDIPMEHVPTITGDIGTIKIGKLHFHLWDFAGQEQFSFLWNNFIKGSDAVLLITDSSLENCEKSKYFVELIKKEAPYSHAAAIGNKQDLPEAMPILDIERHLGIKAYSMIATDVDNRNKMIQIIADILEMSGEISPLLKPLLERDKKLIDLEKCLESGNIEQSIIIFEELADLSLELGDDRVSQDFIEKAQKMKETLKKMGKTIPEKHESPQVKPPEAASSASTAVNPPSHPPVMPPPPKMPQPGTSIPAAPKVTPPEIIAASIPTPPKMPPTSTPASGTPVQSELKNIDDQDKLGAMLSNLGNSGAPITQISENDESVLGKGSNFAKAESSIPAPPPAPKIPDSTNAISGESSASPAPIKSPILPPGTGSTSNSEKTKMITDLKIKMANIGKSALDLEMQNIMGELSDDDYKVKLARLDDMKDKIKKQIDEIEKI